MARHFTFDASFSLLSIELTNCAGDYRNIQFKFYVSVFLLGGWELKGISLTRNMSFLFTFR